MAAKLPEPACRNYLQGLIWRHPSTGVRLGAYREYFLLLRRSGIAADSVRLMTLLDSAAAVCIDGSCGSEAVIEAALGYAGMKAWRMKRLKEGSESARRYYENLLPDALSGRKMPPFGLIAVDSARTPFSSVELLGKPYVLMVVNARMCGYTEGVDAMIEAARDYAAQGLRSIICYDIPDNPAFTRFTSHLEYPVYLPGEGRDALRALNGKYAEYPYFALLVDADGIIRASTQRLVEEVLFFTLRDFFGER